MKLNNEQIAELVEAVEEELTEMTQYTNIGCSQVVDVLTVDGFRVNIEVFSEDFDEEE